MRRVPQRHAARPRETTAGGPEFSLLALALLASLGAGPGPQRSSAEITAILARGPHAGECTACHTMHGEGQLPEVYALVGPDDNSLCDNCHLTPWEGGSYPGMVLYARSAHGSSGTMVWPGPNPPPRTEPGAAGKCVNCHDPHGRTDAQGDIPSLGLARGEALCVTCHDGSPAMANVLLDLQRPFRHPVSIPGRHTGPLESLPTDFGAAPLDRRHAECVDCHNPHFAYADPAGSPLGTALSKRNLGVSRVQVQNGIAGIPPTYAFVAAADTLSPALAEYELCFKCHSSWTTQPSGQTDLALALNPSNPSFHPVEAPGANPTIRPGAFVPGWGPTSITRCGDCHGSDAGTAAGPHGSSYRYILKAPYTASPQDRFMTPDEICFACHAYAVYADDSSPESVQGDSRFNEPGADKGHVKHVGNKDVPCYACHTTHGSTTLPNLLVTGRSPGLINYTQTAGGGTCTPTCHKPESYTVNYAR